MPCAMGYPRTPGAAGGTVCDDGFTDTSARVACRSLGLPYTEARLQYSYGDYGDNGEGLVGRTGPIWLDQVIRP